MYILLGDYTQVSCNDACPQDWNSNGKLVLWSSIDLNDALHVPLYVTSGVVCSTWTMESAVPVGGVTYSVSMESHSTVNDEQGTMSGEQ